MRSPTANACVCRYVRHPSMGILPQQRDVEINFFDAFADLGSSGPCTLRQVEQQLSEAARVVRACAADVASHAAERVETAPDESTASAECDAVDERAFGDEAANKAIASTAKSPPMDAARVIELLASATQVRPSRLNQDSCACMLSSHFRYFSYFYVVC